MTNRKPTKPLQLASFIEVAPPANIDEFRTRMVNELQQKIEEHEKTIFQKDRTIRNLKRDLRAAALVSDKTKFNAWRDNFLRRFKDDIDDKLENYIDCGTFDISS
jgi:ribosome recycling factor